MYKACVRLAAGSLVILAAGCGVSDPSGPPPLLTELPRSLSAGERTAIAANNHLGLELLASVTRAEPGANAFVSPLSLSLALGMVLNGAAGLTRDSMARTLGFASPDQSEINASYRSLLDLLLGLDRTTDITIANSIWAERTFPIEPAFLASAQQYFDAEVQSLDFRSPDAVVTINDWVDRKTKGKIPTILDRIAPEEILFAVNAVYFKGAWRDAFSREDTRARPFTAIDGRVQSVPFMHRNVEAPYRAGPDFQAIDLWYGNGAYAMTVVLPDPGQDVNALAARLDPTAWTALTTGLQPAKVALALPKLRLEYQRRLNDDLAALGMRRAFDPDLADFTGIAASGGLYLTRVEHKTFVDVNEEGTEAAAVTSVGVGVTSAPPSMVVDRPFLFAIRERLSGTIMFLGRITAIPGA